MGEYGNGFLNKDDQLVEIILMNLETTYDIFYLGSHTSWNYIKEDGDYYTFDSLFGLIIRVDEKFLDEVKPKNKQQAHLIKGKG